MPLELVGPQTAAAVFKCTQADGAIGKGHQGMDKAVKRLFANDGFELKGDTRLEKFTTTIKTFSKGGAVTGAMVGVGVMFPVDILTGRGRIRAEFERSHVMDQGVLGNMALGMTTASSVAMEGVGLGAGGMLGAVNPAALTSTKGYREWVKKHAKGGQKVGAGFTSIVVGGPLGTALTIARLPSLFVKYLLAGAFAIPSVLVGFLSGSIRAIINK